MRVLALARYRFLLSLRSPTMAGAFWGTGIAVVLITAAMVSLVAAMPFPYSERYRTTASVFLYLYMMHVTAVVLATVALGMTQRQADSSPASSLVETAPVTHVAAFWGDTLGIFAAAASVHLLWLPLIAVTFAITPYPALALLGVETLLLAAILLVSCAGAWSLRSDSWRLAMARLTRGMSLVVLVMVVALVLMTKSLRVFGDAISGFQMNPGAAAWSQIVASMSSPAAVPVVFAVVYLALITFFSLDAARRAARLE